MVYCHISRLCMVYGEVITPHITLRSWPKWEVVHGWAGNFYALLLLCRGSSVRLLLQLAQADAASWMQQVYRHGTSSRDNHGSLRNCWSVKSSLASQTALRAKDTRSKCNKYWRLQCLFRGYIKIAKSARNSQCRKNCSRHYISGTLCFEWNSD